MSLITGLKDRFRHDVKPLPSEEALQEEVSFIEGDKAWDSYMQASHSDRELVALLTDSRLEPRYQQRILQIFFHPNPQELPFPVNIESSKLFSLSIVNWRTTINEQQAIWAAELIETYIPQFASKKGDMRSREASEEYNEEIRMLLPLLPQPQAESLFAYFDLNGSSPSYGPFERLLFDEAVDEFWKRKAAVEMHERIKREKREKRQPVNRLTTAAYSYGFILTRLVFREEENLPITREFFQEEIAFMLGIGHNAPIIDLSKTGQAMALLDSPEIRHGFARHQVLTADTEEDWVDNKEMVEVAERIRVEFPEDRELNTFLDEGLKRYQVRSRDQRQAEEERKTKEEALFEKMRVSSE